MPAAANRSFTFVPYAGRVELDDINPEQILIEDIAFILSRKPRFNGASALSIGVHCLCASDKSEREGHDAGQQLEHLLHDASETYLSDLIRPIKRRIPWYQEIEGRWENAIFSRFGLSRLQGYREIDDYLLGTEIVHQFKNQLDQWTVKPVFDQRQFEEYDRYLCYTPRAVEALFLARFQSLYRQIANTSWPTRGTTIWETPYE